MICSFECTFCSACLELLENVCPNCGGGSLLARFGRRNWRGDNFLSVYPASTIDRHRPVDLADHEQFAAALRSIDPRER